MARIAGAAADAQDEQPAATFADGRELLGGLLNGGFVQLDRRAHV